MWDAFIKNLWGVTLVILLLMGCASIVLICIAILAMYGWVAAPVVVVPFLAIAAAMTVLNRYT